MELGGMFELDGISASNSVPSDGNSSIDINMNGQNMIRSRYLPFQNPLTRYLLKYKGKIVILHWADTTLSDQSYYQQ